jgi:hypothetical protein
VYELRMVIDLQVRMSMKSYNPRGRYAVWSGRSFTDVFETVVSLSSASKNSQASNQQYASSEQNEPRVGNLFQRKACGGSRKVSVA